RAFYTKNPAVAKNILKSWGEPVNVQPLGSGMEKRYYKISNPYPPDLGYRYFVVKDDKVVYSGITDMDGSPKSLAAEKDIIFNVGDLSKSFYSRHPDIASKVLESWGTPVNVMQLENGIEQRVYKINNPYPSAFGYRYFRVKDGKVLASGLAESDGTAEAGLSNVCRPLSVSELSREYYAINPMSEQTLNHVWGKPIDVRDIGDGIEQRTYKIRNAYPASFGFRYFQVKDGQVIASGITDMVQTCK
ncbi:MAG: hypothetical protein DRH32_06435, partial [Deltaproteobacteria bacterium]